VKTSCRVENLTPVPLKPLDEVLDDIGPPNGVVALYIPHLAMRYDGPYHGNPDPDGWYLFDPLAGEFHSVCRPEWWPEPNEVDYHATLARRLQPGERLVAIHEG
jgi:hypothetical protein